MWLLLIPPAVCSCQQADDKKTFSQLSWLLGTWEGEANGQPFYEQWVKEGETAFANANFSLCNGDTLVNSRSRIELRNGKIAYTSGELTWELTEISNTSCIFENTRYHEKFIFSISGNGDWIADLNYSNSSVKY